MNSNTCHRVLRMLAWDNEMSSLSVNMATCEKPKPLRRSCDFDININLEGVANFDRWVDWQIRLTTMYQNSSLEAEDRLLPHLKCLVGILVQKPK